MCTAKNVTVGAPERDGRRKSPRTTSTMPGFLECVNRRVRLESVVVEQDGGVRVAMNWSET